jgi:DnaJ-class molecular chaperone
MTDLEALTKLIEELEKNQAILFQNSKCTSCEGTGLKLSSKVYAKLCLICNGTGKVIVLKPTTNT